VIGTNWEVHDEAAVALATAFYDGLFHGKSAEEALRAAKRDALDRKLVVRGAAPIDPGAAPPDDGLAHPHYWAPYVLWGGAPGGKR
jgi:CHAT domain-containing protein